MLNFYNISSFIELIYLMIFLLKWSYEEKNDVNQVQLNVLGRCIWKRMVLLLQVKKHKNYMYVIIVIIIFKCLIEFKICIYLITE